MDRHLHAAQKIHKVFERRITGRVTASGYRDPLQVSSHQLQVAEHIICHIPEIFEPGIVFTNKIGAVVTPDRKRQAVFTAEGFRLFFLADPLKVTVFTEAPAVQTGPASDIDSQVCHNYVLF